LAEIRFLTDEDLKSAIFDGVLRRLPSLDIVRVQDVGLRTFRDPLVLEFAAKENRVLITHDVSTMRGFAINRIVAGKSMPGLIEIGQNFPIRRAVEELVIIAECSYMSEWKDQIRRLPL
jgi:Domain of unknown function (DUF5615)